MIGIFNEEQTVPSSRGLGRGPLKAATRVRKGACDRRRKGGAFMRRPSQSRCHCEAMKVFTNSFMQKSLFFNILSEFESRLSLGRQHI